MLAWHPLSSRFVLSLLASLLCLPLAASAQEPVRVGVVGLDNYQAVAYTQLFNSPKAEGDLAGLKVTAAVPLGSPDIEESVENLPKWHAQIQKFGVEIVDSIDEVLKRCDVVMIMSLDGRTHLAQATPVLKAGKRLYIGRPLAASLPDAAAIFKLAEETKTPCFSSSQHRFSPGFIGMRKHPEVGKVLGCDVYGGCPTEPHHAELFWHAVHGIDTLYTIMGPGCVSLTCQSTPYAEAITGVWADGRVGTFRGIKQGALEVQRHRVRREGGFDRRRVWSRRAGRRRRADQGQIHGLRRDRHRDGQVLQRWPGPRQPRRNPGSFHLHGSGPSEQKARRNRGEAGRGAGNGSEVDS